MASMQQNQQSQIKTRIGDKVPPHNIEIEEALLGSILIDNSAMRKVFNNIKISDFYSQRNGVIYDSCLAIYGRREAINELSVGQELSRCGKLDSCGGASYLSHLILATPTPLDVEYYAKDVSRLAVSRNLISYAEKLSNIGYSSTPDINTTIEKISEMWNGFRRENSISTSKLITPAIAGNDVLNLLNKYSEPSHVPSWGFDAMDEITGGIFKEYIVIGARPSTGKTQLMLDVAENVSSEGYKALYISAEMEKEQIYERKVARRISTNILQLRKFGLEESQRDILVDLSGEISQTNISYLAGGIFLSDIYKEVYTLLDKGKLDIVFIDYLGALRDCYVDKENQNVRISRISNKIQDMVHEFHIPFVVASQLNREVEHRGDEKNNKNGFVKKSKPPQLSDLRDSGSIEQDADVVFLLHRDENEDGTLSNILKIGMKKNRQLGTSKPIQLIFDYKSLRYRDFINREEGT